MPLFLSIGHVSRDDFPDGAHRLGGTALYAAATAARLGVETALVTRVGPNEREELTRTCRDLHIDLRILDANVTTTFGFRWDEQGKRILTLKARAKGIALADIPADLRSADALVFGSIAHELSDDLLLGEPARVSVLAAQGMLRMWDADGTVRPTSWDRADENIRALTAVVLSEDDVAGDAALVERWSHITTVVLTLAERGCRVYQAGHPTIDLPSDRVLAAADGPLDLGARRGVRLPEDGHDLRRVAAALALPVDLRKGRWRRADEQRGRASSAARGHLAPDQRGHR